MRSGSARRGAPEDELLARWRPARQELVLARGRRQPHGVGSVGVHDVDLVVPVAPAHERDPAAVRRPSRLTVVVARACQPEHVPSIRPHDVQLLVVEAGAVAGEDDPLAVR